MASEQLVKHCAESVDIRGASDSRVITHRLFRRHVTGCTQHFQRACNSAFGFHQPRQTKIGEMRFAFLIKQNISRLDVSMQNAVFVRVMHGARHLRDEFRRLPDRHGRVLDYFVQLASFDELHAEITGAIPLADLVDGDDARMIEAGGGFRLQTKTLKMRFGRPLTKTDHFQRHCAVKTFLPRAKYHALSAASDFLQQFVVAQFSQHLGDTRGFFTIGSSIRIPRFNIFSGAAVIASGYR